MHLEPESAAEQQVDLRVSPPFACCDSDASRRLPFAHPIGLGAGFDKDGVAIAGMLQMGFSFVELGTVTPWPQPGNPSPRMFRLVPEEGIINRYGFNSAGAVEVQQTLHKYRQIQNPQAAFRPVASSPPPPLPPSLHEDFSPPGQPTTVAWWEKALTNFGSLWLRFFPMSIPPSGNGGIIGVNIGKNKWSTTDEEVTRDYVYNIHTLGPYADYLVVNVSSPNTPGLRLLQQVKSLEKLLSSCIKARNQLPWHYTDDHTEPDGGKYTKTTRKTQKQKQHRVPLLVKLAPDLTDKELHEIGNLVMRMKVDGIVVSNTTKARPADLVSHHMGESGGLSGRPVRERSTECIRILYKATQGKVPIVGVGGVGTGRDAFEKLCAGASVVEVYSMMVYRGPGCVSKIRRELAEVMLQNNFQSIEDVIGSEHSNIGRNR
jgi:dihydroorotate dehydrogenase